MTKNDWRALNLLRVPPTSGSNLFRCRSILRDIVTCAVVNDAPTLWRGHSSIDYHICPTIARGVPHLRDRNQRVIELTKEELGRAEQAARRWRDGNTFLALPPIEQLSHLRHHGVPSPLLDVTPDPFIALWFASADDTKDGVLVGFNQISRFFAEVPRSSDLVEIFERALIGGTYESHSEDRHPFAEAVRRLERAGKIGLFDPPVLNDRIVVQRSRFLLSTFPGPGRWHDKISDVWLPALPYGWDAERLDRVFAHEGVRGRPVEVPLVGLLVPRVLKRNIRSILDRHFGVSTATVYPDVNGLLAQINGTEPTRPR